MRWLGLVVLLAGCDALFQIDHLKQPPDDGRAIDVGENDDALVDAPHDAVPGRARFVQAAQTLLDGTALSLTVPNPQVAGDLNVLCISWIGGSGALVSITDVLGNTWSNTAGTASYTSTNQVLYYAHNINPGMNQITVTFNVSVTMANIRLVEYANIAAGDPKLTEQAAVGSGMTMTSASVTVTQKALIVGGFVSSFTGITPGANFNERIEQSFGYLEDRDVLASGTYSATATQSNPGPYIAHIAAFAVL